MNRPQLSSERRLRLPLTRLIWQSLVRGHNVSPSVRYLKIGLETYLRDGARGVADILRSMAKDRGSSSI